MRNPIYGKVSGRRKTLSKVRFCRVNGAEGYIVFNACALRDLGMAEGQKMLFMQNSDTRAWFFAVSGTDRTAGGSNVNIAYNRGRAISARVNNKYVARRLIERCRQDNVTLNISMFPRRSGGREWYRIVTTTPYKIYIS